MASEINSDRSNATQDLRDLQETYRKRRQQLEAEGSMELERTRQSNKTKLLNENTASEAAISHVKAANGERLEQLKKESEQNLLYEKKSLVRQAQSEDANGKEELQALQSGLRMKTGQVQQETREENMKEADLRTRESHATQEIAQQQTEARAKIMSQEQMALQDFNKRVADKKELLSQKSRQEISSLGEKNKQEIDQLLSQHKQTYSKQADWSEAQLKNLREQEAQTYASERDRLAKGEVDLRDHAQRTLQSEQAGAVKEYQEAVHENQAQLNRTRDTGVRGMEKTRAYYDKNIAVVEKKGDERLTEQKEIQNSRLRLMEQENKEALQKQMQEHESELHNSEMQYNKQSALNKNFYNQSLLKQKHEYDRSFNENIKAFEAQVHSQREMLNKSLIKDKKEVVEDVGRYNAKNSDPFYRLAQSRAELTDNGDHYILQAEVPEHEKDNVRVIVRPDKVILQGERRFADHVDDTDSKIATHSYQTYRQEIPLEHPVREKLVQKNYDNGILTVKIRKA